MDTKILVVCPTRGRPKRFLEMLKSFYATRSTGTQFRAYVADDDPDLRAYEAIIEEHYEIGSGIEVGPRKTIVEVFNRAVWNFTADYYVDCNDDFIFKTKGWDDVLWRKLEANGRIGMAHGVTKRLPCAAMISRRNIETLGWWMYPKCKHQFIDSINRALYKAAGQLYSVPSVEVEHVHPSFMPGESGAALWDETYAHIYSPEVWKHDEAACAEWALNEAEADIKKLKELK